MIKIRIKDKIKGFIGSKAGKTVLTAVSFIPALAALALAVYYILGPGEGYFHSDCSDSLYWANASVEAGKVFDDTYRYAALLPFSGSAWMAVLIKLFGFGMTAHNIGMIIFAVLFAASIWFLCSACGFGRGWCSVSVFTTFMILSSSDKLREILWGHTIYYSVALIIFFTAAALTVKAGRCMTEGAKGRACVYFALLCALAAGAATDGGQVIVIGTLPVLAGIAAERIFCGSDKLISYKSLPAVSNILVICAGTLAGLILLKAFRGDSVSASYADAYSGWSEMSAWAGNLQNFGKQFLSLIGVKTDGDSLFSTEAIPSMIRIAVGIVILAAPVVMLVLYRHLSGTGVKILLWGHFVITAAIMFGFICGKLSGANWRLTPIVGSAALLTVMGARELCYRGKCLQKEAEPCAAFESHTEDAGESYSEEAEEAYSEEAEEAEDKMSAGRVLVRAGALLLAILCLGSLISAKEIKSMPADYGRNNYNHRLAAFLEENGLEYGYGTFWYCQAITVISESKVRCREVLANKNGVYTDYYQSSRRWYDGQEYDKYFVVLTDSEYSAVCTSSSWKNWIVNYYVTDYSGDEGVDGFVIYVFNCNVLDPALGE